VKIAFLAVVALVIPAFFLLVWLFSRKSRRKP